MSTQGRPPAARSFALVLALAAGGTGLLAGPADATATSSVSSPTPHASSDWLEVTWSGGDDSTVVQTAGVPGGGTTVSYLQKPPSQGGKPAPKKLTLSVQGKAIAAETAALEDGSMVPAANSDLDAKQSKGVTTLSVEATDEAQTLVFLPEEAPKAADPDDQDDVDGWWSKLVGWITGDDSDDTAAREDTTTSSTTATSSPSGTSTSSPSGTSTSSPTGTSTSSPTGTSTSSPSKTSGGGDVCVVTQGQKQQGTAEESEGGQDKDYAVSDGPTAAPTFSDETRKKAAVAASDCGEGGGTEQSQGPSKPGGLVSDDSPPPLKVSPAPTSPPATGSRARLVILPGSASCAGHRQRWPRPGPTAAATASTSPSSRPAGSTAKPPGTSP